MALRVAMPNRVRAVAAICLAAGLALLEESGAQGVLGWTGGLVFSFGVAFLDGLDEGRVGARQWGMVLFLVGVGAAGWALTVIFMTRFFLPQEQSPFFYVVLTGGVAFLLAGVRMRRPDLESISWPRSILSRVREISRDAVEAWAHGERDPSRKTRRVVQRRQPLASAFAQMGDGAQRSA